MGLSAGGDPQHARGGALALRRSTLAMIVALMLMILGAAAAQMIFHVGG